MSTTSHAYPPPAQEAPERRAVRPLISVVTIFLNAEPFLGEAIQSVLAQTFDQWELLLVDDGSSDGSTMLAKQYARADSRIVYLEHAGHANLGMSASRNLGIHEAKGEYIAFLDADDVFLPTKLERQLHLLTTNPDIVMVYGPSRVWHGWTGETKDQSRDSVRRLGVWPGRMLAPDQLVTRFLVRKSWTPQTSAVLIRRHAIEQVGGYENSFRGMYEDQVFFYKLCLRFPVMATADCLNLYRKHSQSWCETTRQAGEWDPYRPNSAEETFLRWFEAYLDKLKVGRGPVRQALSAQLWPYRHPRIYRTVPGLSWIRRVIRGLRNRLFRPPL